MKKVVGLIMGLVPVSVSAQCIPSPDCASLGYIEISCEGDSLKCPFDTSKLYCPPCDSSFKYACSGDNVANAVGNACNNKYVTCNCVAGATFNNGECICDTSCDNIGNIYYSDGTCSSCDVTGKTPVGIVAYKDESKHLLVALEKITEYWTTSQKDENGNEVIAYNIDIEDMQNYSNADLAITDFNGFENTQAIVSVYSENAVGVAAVYCYNYAPIGWESSKGQWYLPAMGELNILVFDNMEKINKGLSTLSKSQFPLYHYFSSTETNAKYVWSVSSWGTVFTYGKDRGGVGAFCVLSL